jgi:hypothetical protein
MDLGEDHNEMSMVCQMMSILDLVEILFQRLLVMCSHMFNLACVI